MAGYPEHLFVQPVQYRCAVCRQVPRNPYRTDCGHNACYYCLQNGHGACRDCFDQIKSDDCQVQFEQLPPIDRTTAEQNMDLCILIGSLLIRCPYEGCIHHQAEAAVSVAEYTQHIGTCEHRIITCTVCSANMTYEDFRNHAHFQPPVQDEITCAGCFRVVLSEKYLEHLLYERGYCAASDNGHYIWPVKDLTEARDQARSRVTRALRSPPFLTAPDGYTLCLFLYLDGNEEGLHTHISVYVVLMHGRFDNLNAWPFNRRILLTLRKKGYNNGGITRGINPQDLTTIHGTPQCFDKPSADPGMNDKVGFHKFASQSEVFPVGKISDYIDRDMMFLEAKVE